MKYDKEEKGIVEAYEKGKMKLSTPPQERAGGNKVCGKEDAGKRQKNNDKALRSRFPGHSKESDGNGGALSDPYFRIDSLLL